jgi:hypothetical protein
MLTYLRALWATNPVRVTSVLTALVVFAAAKAGLVLDEQNVGESLIAVVPILLGGEVARSKVSPFVGEVGPASDDLLSDEAKAQLR